MIEMHNNLNYYVTKLQLTKNATSKTNIVDWTGSDLDTPYCYMTSKNNTGKTKNKVYIYYTICITK